MTRLLPIFILILYSNCTISQNHYEKYTIEKGTINSIFFPFESDSSKSIEIEISFKEFGRIENYNIHNAKNNFDRILKIDSLEYHIFSKDSIGIETIRKPLFVFDLIILKENSQLNNNDIILKFISDTTFLDKKCEYYTFQNSKSNLSGTAIFWNGIPFYINSQLGKMIAKSYKSDIVETNLKLDEYIDVVEK